MKCPYCAEDIKDEAMVCRHCHRDLTLFKPIDRKIEELKSELASLTECVTKMAAFLDRQQVEERIGGDSGDVKTKKKPGFWRKLFVALLQLVLTILLLIAYVGLLADLEPRIPYVLTADENGNVVATSGQQEYEQYEKRANLLTKVFVGAVFVMPIGLGIWIGLRWPGRNLKQYLITGFMASVPIVLFLSVGTVAAILLGIKSPGDISFALLIAGIDLLRCLFGFAAGGLIGDWIERRRYPQFYSRGFTESLTTLRRSQARGFDRITLGFGRLTTSMAPVIPLIGVIITSMVGFYTAQTAARKAAQPEKPPIAAPPAPRSSPSP